MIPTFEPVGDKPTGDEVVLNEQIKMAMEEAAISGLEANDA